MSVSPNAASRRSLSNCFWVVVAILALSFAANLLTLANPGFFNHDEWQRLDHIRLYGFANYVKQYGAIQAGTDFGYPVRPIGFVQQGFSALFMDRMPVVAHLIDVIIHTLCALVFWWALQATAMRGRRAVVAAAVFAVSPLATFSTAWVGASFDRLYVLFAIIAGAGALRVLREGFRPWPLALLVAGACGAILSKETAIMLPAALVLMFAAVKDAVGLPRQHLPRAIGILAVASLPILAYLAIRLPALQASFGGHAGAYDPTKGSVTSNALLYFAQPFLPRAVELVSAVFIPKWQWYAAAALHALLVLALVLKRGVWAGLVYLCGYFVFLLPVLPLSIVGAHYLYGSGLAFSIGMALLLPSPDEAPGAGRVARTVLFAFLLVLAAGHAWYIQTKLYASGVCQTVVLHTLDAQVEDAKRAGRSAIEIIPEPGALGYVAVRSTFARLPYSADDGFPVEVRENGTPSTDERVQSLRMDQQCRLVRQ